MTPRPPLTVPPHVTTPDEQRKLMLTRAQEIIRKGMKPDGTFHDPKKTLHQVAYILGVLPGA